jgi:hypothetical protein
MIAEAFLTCALAAPPTNFHRPEPIHNQRLFQEIVAEYRRVLFVGGDPGAVKEFRKQGLKVFGAMILDAPGATRWHIVADPGLLAFDDLTFHQVRWLERNIWYNVDPNYLMLVLGDALRTVEPHGYFMFDKDEYRLWPALLDRWHWELMPFTLNSLVVYKKPYYGDYLLRPKTRGMLNPWLNQDEDTKIHRNNRRIEGSA